MPLDRQSGAGPERDEPYVERAGRFWQVVFPAAPDDGMDLCTGPHFTHRGARLSLWFHNWLERRDA